MKTKKLLAIVLTFILSFGVLSMAHAEGTPEIPEGYTPIYTAEDLNNIRNDLAGKYILMNDIDLSAYENWEPIGTADAPFTGELNGNGYLIRNLTIKALCSETENYLGLFGVVENVPFTSVIVENGFISASPADNATSSNSNVSAGMIAGRIIGSEKTRKQIRSCSTTGRIEITGFKKVATGGLIGDYWGKYSLVMSSNYVDLHVTTTEYEQTVYAGGILGTKDNGTSADFDMVRVANFGDIMVDNTSCSEKSKICIAGISNNQLGNDQVEDCYNEGCLSTSTSIGEIVVGGIIGDEVSLVVKSFNIGEIDVPADANDKIGAICGIVGTQGGLATMAPGNYYLKNCYYMNDGLNSHYKEPDDDYIYDYNIKLITDEEAKKQETFKNFNFELHWIMEEESYPIIKVIPSVVVKENIELKVDDTCSVKAGESYSSTNNAVATINELGKIVALTSGTATVTIEYEYGYCAEYTVTVIKSEKPSEPVTEPNEPTTQPDEPITDPTEPADKCWIEEFWIVKIIRWILHLASNIVEYVISLF